MKIEVAGCDDDVITWVYEYGFTAICYFEFREMFLLFDINFKFYISYP